MAYSLCIFQLIASARAADRPREMQGKHCHNSRFEVAEMKHFILSFLKDEEGLTMVEYAIAGALVAAGAVGAFTTLGGNVVTRITDLANDVITPAPAA
jgi:pilus assembly protein Flp/PilA